MKSLKVFAALFTLLLINVCFQVIASSPEVLAFAQDYSLGTLHAFMFGDPLNAFVVANAPALTIQFSKNIEMLPEPNLGFLAQSVDESMYVQGEKVVRPVAGGFPKVVTDPKSFPLKVEQKDDDQLEYAIKLHATLPQRIGDWQELQQSYPSRDGILNRHQTALRQKIGREMLYNWSPSASASIIETSGGAKAAGLAKFGADGQRKMVTRDDILSAIQIINELDFDEDLNMLIPASFKNDIRKIPEFVSYDKTGIPAGYSRNAIGEIEGVVVMTRSTGLIYNSTKTPVRVETDETTNLITVADEACQAILIWNRYSVFRAIGKMRPYIDPKSGLLLGGTVNFSQAAGGNIRKDGLGVVAIVEKTV